MPILQFGEYLPDLPTFKNPGVTTATNVVPSGNSYKSMKSPSVYSTALSNPNLGAYSTRDKDSNVYTYAGDSSALYELSEATYSDVSKSGGYTTANDGWWQFATFGEKVIATNFGDDPQIITMGGANFENLAGTPPKARSIAIVRNFVVLGNTNDTTDGSVPNRVRWSGIDDETAWTVSSVTQSDFQDLQGDGGWVMQIVGGEYGIVFQERSIWRMSYVGSPIVFQFDEVEKGRGTPAPNSVVKIGSWIAYLGRDGFYIFDGQRSTPIGSNKVDDVFWSDFDSNYFQRVIAVADPEAQLIYWGYPSTTSSSGRINKILVYNYATNSNMRWSLIDSVDLQSIFQSQAEGYTLEQLDTVSSSLDALEFSLDSRVWTGNSTLLSGFDSDNKQVNFDGAAMDATIETQEEQISSGKRSSVTLVRPIVDGSSATVTIQIGERNLLTDSVTWQSEISTNSTGDCPVRSNARYHRARVKITGGFDHAQGVDVVRFRMAGNR